MTASPHDRAPRSVPDQSVFDKRTFETITIPAGRWMNLRWGADAKRERLFYASPSGRLTPSGGKVPCLYLSPTERTSFFELYGDAIALAERDEEPALIETNDLKERVFIDVIAPEMRLLDLTTGSGMESIHIDTTTITHTVIDFPRKWAQAIYDHKDLVDGIYYESRHTKQKCVVVWIRGTVHGFDLETPRSLGSKATLLPSGNIEIFGKLLMPVS